MITKPIIRILIAFTLLLGYTAATFAQSNNTSQAPGSEQPVMQLGKIQVKGEKQIIKLLQTIKVALRQPYSSDPKLANVVVCRITNDIGSHAVQLLTCDTNRTHAKRKALYQTAMMTPIPNHGNRADVLTEFLSMMPSNRLQAPVNGPELRALLKKIPDPDTGSSGNPHAQQVIEQ